jgi:uncharacterized protein (TIGR02145 family)
MKNKLIYTFILFTFFLISCDEDERKLDIGEYSISSPKANEIIYKELVCVVEWYAPLATHVNIELYQDSEFIYSVEKEFVNKARYRWMITESIPTGSNYYLKISNSDDTELFALSNISFSIKSIGQSTFTDTRDGQIYRVTRIGDQTWMAENFNYDSPDGSACYMNIESAREEFGKLYNREAALRDHPEGWHLPTDDEWKTLEDYIGNRIGRNLQESASLGFYALLAGYYNGRVNAFGHRYVDGYFWSATTNQNGKQVFRVLSDHRDDFSYVEATRPSNMVSVRYIKD